MNNNPSGLDALLALAKSQQPLPPQDFLDTALANAYANIPAPVPAPLKSAPFWSQMRETFGGWKSATALAASALAGIWLGYSDWQSIASSGMLAGITSTYDNEISALDAFESVDSILSEG